MFLLFFESDAFVTCPPNRPDRLADAVERLMADPAERARLGMNGRAYVERHAGRDAAARAYRALIGDPPGPILASAPRAHQ
ncbi:hypothetical protein [Thiobaca trueperi]|uniref:Glycosyl transferase family 1 n=1 Tax=Thiobaca trueperi TaxID=127458 RepID=A0A4R3MWM3_9GAMM|nr:hypothetical protein [Thiobaca trueperi]TCT18699.1 hypothetical protein EDC35_11222 [Thiobaca trueperi]